jgi:hypothetical protein
LIFPVDPVLLLDRADAFQKGIQSMKIRKLIPAFLIIVLLIIQVPSPNARAASAVIYDDQLAQGWENWSWAVVDMKASSPVYSGSSSIAITYSSWCGLYLAQRGGISTSSYSFLRFYIHGGSAGGQKFRLFAHLNGVEGPAVNVPVPQANTWLEVRVPLIELGAAGKSITGLTWQSTHGSPQPTFYIDEIALVDDSSPGGPVLDQSDLHPRSLHADGSSLVIAQVQVVHPGGLSQVSSVSLNASSLGLGSIAMHDDGATNDALASDGIYGARFAIPIGTPRGEYSLSITARDIQGRQIRIGLPILVVLEAPGGNIPSSLPSRLGWGRSWQDDTGQNWDYVYQYITWGWQGWGGNFVNRVVEDVWGRDDIPMITVYMMLGVPPECGEGGQCYYNKLQNASTVQAYLSSLAQAAAEAAGSHPVIFNLEPDFYGFMQQLSNSSSRPAGVHPDDPTSIPVALNISGYPNTLAGFGRRMVDVVRVNAPNALVAPMASVWATNGDPSYVSSSEAISMGQRTGAFIRDMGGAEADLIIVEWSDRDSGSGIRPWWDDSDLNLPRVNRALLWENAVSSITGKRLILWQVPAGNMSLPNVCQQYKDNRAAYAFDHPRDLFDAGVIGVLFGAGDGCGTSLKTDGGYIVSRTIQAYSPPEALVGLNASQAFGIAAALRWNESSEPDLWGYRLTYSRSGTTPAVFDVGRANSAVLVFPSAGQWLVQVAAYDAMGQESVPSQPVTITIFEDANLTYLPLLGRP